MIRLQHPVTRIAVGLVLLLSAVAADAKEPLAIFHVGNSLTDFKHVADLYEDGVHLNSAGKYLEAVTHYAAVFQEDPHDCIISGLRFWRAPYSVDKPFAQVVWDVVAEVTKPKPATAAGCTAHRRNGRGSGPNE